MEVFKKENERARLSLDFDDDLGIDSKIEIDKKVKEISEESGFVSTTPKIQKKEKNKIRPNRRRRARTGRTYPFNTKIKPETYDMICELADTATEEEGRPISLAEIIERSIAALEEKNKFL